MSLGLIDPSARKVRPISEIAKLVDFGKLQYSDKVIHPDGSVEQTVDFMKNIVRDHYKDVQKLADKLYDPKPTRFLRNIFDFVMNYIKYEKDSAFMEQLRVPLRTLQDQKGDCDCMSILIGSILHAKNIPFNFRITKYNRRSEFQHVYVIVPNNNGSYTVVDPVIRAFDKEKPFDEKKDFYVDSRLAGFCGLSGMPIQLLNGHSYVSGVTLAGGLHGLYGDIMAVTMGTDLFGFGLGTVEDDEMAMYNHLVRTRDVILAKPQLFKIMKNPLEVARMLDYAIRYWDTPQIDHVLGVLENEEQRLLREGTIVYPHADLSGFELGELGAGFFKKIGSAVKKVAQKVSTGAKTAAKAVGKGVVKVAKATGKGVATAAKATGKAVAKGAKAVAKVVARFNPVSLAARGGLLLAIRTNLFKLADKLQYGLYTETQAKAAGINLDDFRKMQESFTNARNIFVNTLKGKEDKFKQAITKGVKHKAIKGLDGLGELGAAGAALVTAALGFITSILGLFKGKKNPKTGETIADENVSEGDVQDLMNQAESYDEDGNPITAPVNTTAEPEAEGQNFFQRATGLIKDTASNLINNFIPQNSGGNPSASYDSASDSEYAEYDEPVNQQSMIISPATQQSTAVTANVMGGGMMANIGNFIKKNYLILGIGTVGIAGAAYFLTRKKKSRGLSGLPRTNKKRNPNKPNKYGAKRRLKSVKLT